MLPKNQAVQQIDNEEGFVLIATLLILTILLFIGIIGTNTSVFELKIAENEKMSNRKFIVSDSGWKQSGPWLNAKATAPNIINLTFKTGDTSYDWSDEYYQIVRNYGEGLDAVINDDFPAASIDGTLSQVPYWYRILYMSDSQAIEFGANYRDFLYEVKSVADGSTEVKVQIGKVFRVGY